jgi:hypothetical protein
MINKTGLYQAQFSLAKTAYLLPSQPTKLDAIWQMNKLSKMGFCIHIDFKTHNFLAFQDDYGRSTYTPATNRVKEHYTLFSSLMKI